MASNLAGPAQGEGKRQTGVMANAPRKANIYHVAELAGVSHQTVSRVLNGHQSVRPGTKARVEVAMAQLGYRPNTAARTLVTKKSNMLGFLVSDTGLYGPAGMLTAMERQARQAGYVVVTLAVRFGSAESWREGMTHFQDLHIDGLAIIALPAEAVTFAAEVLPGVPVVAIDVENQHHLNAAGIDNQAGSRLATRHLIQLGHRGILHISGPAAAPEAMARTAGYIEEMTAAGLTPHVVQADWSAELGLAVGLEFNFELNSITAVFAANDQLCLGLLKGLRLRGIDVPRDLSLIGFDDIPEAGYFHPPLTTVRQDFNRLGAAAMELLLEELGGQPETKHRRIIPELVVRDSTARI